MITKKVWEQKHFLYPIWAYWACFAPCSSARHPFFLIFSQLSDRDAPTWGTWLKTLHWWRKPERDRKQKKKAQHPAGFEHVTSLLRGVCSTAELQPWPREQKGPSYSCQASNKIGVIKKIRAFHFFHFRLVLDWSVRAALAGLADGGLPHPSPLHVRPLLRPQPRPHGPRPDGAQDCPEHRCHWQQTGLKCE